jgi:hypothetical protein
MLRASGLISIGLVVIFAGTVEAKVSKISDYSAALNGETENPDVDGMAIFHFQSNKGTTAVRINITGLHANSMYNVSVIGDGGFTTPPTETNSGGILHVNHDVPGDITLDYTVDIHVAVFVDSNNDQVLQPSELRAIGCVSGTCSLSVFFPLTCSVDADCDDGNLCSTETCDMGFCSYSPVSCDDGNPLTFDFCNPLTGCEHF